MDSKNFHRVRGFRRLAFFLALSLFGTSAVPGFGAVTEVGDYDSLFSALNNPETTEVSQTAGITLGGNGLAISGSHELSLNQYDLRQGASSGFFFNESESGTPVLGITGDGISSSQFAFTDLVNTGATYGTIRLTDITNSPTDSSAKLNNISGMTLALDHSTVAMGDTLSITSGGLYVDQNSTLSPTGSLSASNNSTIEIQHDYTNTNPTTLDQSTMYVNGNFTGALTASNASGVTVTGDHSGDMEISGLSNVQVAGETRLDGSTLTVKGSQVDEEYGAQYRSILATPQIKGNGTINLSEGALITANDGDDETASASDDLLIQTDGGDLTLNITTNEGGYIQPNGALTMKATDGNNLNVNMNGEGWIQPQTGNLSLLADAGSKLNIDAKGVYENEGQTIGQAVFTTNADAIVGGNGEVNITLKDAASLDSCGNMTLGTGSGTVNVNLEAENWGYMQVGIQGQEQSKLTIGTENSTVNMTINENNSVSGDAGIIAAADAGSTANITLNGGAIMGGSFVSGSGYIYNDFVLGKAGTASLTGTGSVAAKNLIVGKEDGSNAELKTKGSIYAQNLVAGEQEGSTGTVEFGDPNSTFVLYGSNSPLEEDLKAEGNGSITLKDLYGTDETGALNSYALLDQNAQMAAKDVAVEASFLQMNNGSKINAANELTISDGTYINFGPKAELNGKTVNITDTTLSLTGADSRITADDVTITNSFVDAYQDGYHANGLNVTGNLTFDKSAYSLVLNPDGTATSPITVTDGALTIQNGSELYWGFTGDITTDTEWAIATADEGITGEWKLPDEETSPDKETLFRYSQRIETDSETGAATQYLGLSLNEHFFNVRANSLQLARQSLWNTVEDRISWNAGNSAYLGPKSPFNSYNEQYSAWFKAGYRGMNAKGRDGYDMDAFNLAIGMDCAFEDYFAAGAFFHYGNPELKEDHETASADNYSFGIYAGYKLWAGFELKGMLSYTLSDYDMERNLTDFGSAKSSFRGSGLTASAEIARPFFFNRLVIRPLFAVDTECIWQDEAIEEGSYALFYKKNDDTWTYARMGGKLDFAPTDTLVLNVKAFYAIQLDDSGPTTSEARFVSTRDTMQCVGAWLGDHYFNVGATLSWMISDKVTLFGGYDGYFSDQSNIHSGNGGIQFNF